jgi:hypothetical protein
MRSGSLIASRRGCPSSGWLAVQDGIAWVGTGGGTPHWGGGRSFQNKSPGLGDIPRPRKPRAHRCQALVPRPKLQTPVTFPTKPFFLNNAVTLHPTVRGQEICLVLALSKTSSLGLAHPQGEQGGGKGCDIAVEMPIGIKLQSLSRSVVHEAGGQWTGFCSWKTAVWRG